MYINGYNTLIKRLNFITLYNEYSMIYKKIYNFVSIITSLPKRCCAKPSIIGIAS